MALSHSPARNPTANAVLSWLLVAVEPDPEGMDDDGTDPEGVVGDADPSGNGG